MPVQEQTDSKRIAPEPDIPSSTAAPYFETPAGKRTAVWVISIYAALVFVFGFFYLKLAHTVDRRLAGGAFSETVSIYAAPHTIALGDAMTLEDVVGRLRHSGYTSSRSNPMGWYNLRNNQVEVFPGRDSYTGGSEPSTLEFANGKITRIVSLSDHTIRQSMVLEPQLITNLSQQREKRRIVHFTDIPQSLVNAVVSVEDKHFFRHSGFDYTRIAKAAYIDMKNGRKDQGASTLTMQLARGLWLDPDKNWKRKIEELLITMHLEEKLSKQQIFEDYANQVYLGRRGTFSINGFGEAARVYFGKDLQQLTTSEGALLAGMVQRPSYYNPYRYEDRAKDRRNVVLAMMKQNGYLTPAQYQQAANEPVRVVAGQGETISAQYFIDLMNEELQNQFDDQPKHTRYVYTTLDPDLQEAAQAAVDSGMKLVDQQLRKGRKKGPDVAADQPQVALIAMDPHTGEIKALVGGRNYGASQLNHVIAKRQPGSVFKPFVYAAALDTAVAGKSHVFTPASVLNDEPRSFSYDGGVYQPGNFHQQFLGDVTLRTALAHSLNVATVQLAQQVGYGKVVAMARRAGLNEAIKPTPSVALGSYETTPLEIAGAYTLFANAGMHVTPTTISLVRSPDGTALFQHQPDQRPALDPRVAYLMVSMMQDVLRYGTGAGVRGMGFTLPAAGKTGTSHDGWFAGFTSELLCVVWVGFDDNRELNLEGAHSALPVWAEFMKRAAKMRQYRDAKPFQAPSGIVSSNICGDTGQRAGDYCPNVRTEFFIDGTQPTEECDLHSLHTESSADRVVELPDTAATSGQTVPAVKKQ